MLQYSDASGESLVQKEERLKTKSKRKNFRGFIVLSLNYVGKI